MYDDNNKKRPPFPGQGQPPQNQNPQGAQSFGQMNFRSQEMPQQQQPPVPTYDDSPSGAFQQEFSSTHSGFQTNTTGFNAITDAQNPKFDITIKVRAVYGASAFFGAAIIGLFLGFLNSALQGADMLAELGTVIGITLWFAAFVGLLGALKPTEFERIFENIRTKIGD